MKGKMDECVDGFFLCVLEIENKGRDKLNILVSGLLTFPDPAPSTYNTASSRRDALIK